MRFIAILASFVLMGMGPSEKIKSRDSGHIGIGAMKCRVVVSGFSVADSPEMRQWLFGYIAAIDVDVFTLSQQENSTRNQSEQDIALTIASFVKDYCNTRPGATVGDAMVDLQSSYDRAAWERILDAFVTPKISQ